MNTSQDDKDTQLTAILQKNLSKHGAKINTPRILGCSYGTYHLQFSSEIIII